MATAAGFLCFLPTDYKGISELGEIAGVGMLVAFLSSITVLPAILKLLNPPGESEPVGYAFLAPVDRFLEDHRVAIVGGTLADRGRRPAAALFHEVRLQPDEPAQSRRPSRSRPSSICARIPNTGANAINVLTHSEEDAKKIEAKLEKLPEVLRVQSLDSFVPEDQPAKLKLIAQAAKVLNPALNPDSIDAAPSDQENVDSLKSSVENLRRTAGDGKRRGRGRLEAARGCAGEARQCQRGHAQQGAGHLRRSRSRSCSSS